MNRFITYILVFIFLITPLATQSNRVYAFDGGGSKALAWKEMVADPFARKIAQILLKRVNQQIAQIISTGGPGGSPAWITLWDIYARDAQDSGRTRFSKMLHEALFDPEKSSICNYLIEELNDALNPVAPAGRDLLVNLNSLGRIFDDRSFSQRVGCTLPITVNIGGVEVEFNPDAFESDFRNGGWDAFEAMSRPENNYLGVYFEAQDENLTQIIRSEEDAVRESLANDGYQGVRDASGRIVTPGKIFSNVASDIIGTDLDSIVNTDEIGELIFNALGALTFRLTNFESSFDNINANEDAYDVIEDDDLNDRKVEFCRTSIQERCSKKPTVTVCTSEEATTGNTDPATGGTTENTTGSETCVEETDGLQQCLEQKIPVCLGDWGIDTTNVTVACPPGFLGIVHADNCIIDGVPTE